MPPRDAIARCETLSTSCSRARQRYPGIIEAVECFSSNLSTCPRQEVSLNYLLPKEILHFSKLTTATNTKPLCHKSSILSIRFVNMAYHSERGNTLVPSNSSTSEVDPHNPARVAQHQLDDIDPGMIFAKRRAQSEETKRRLNTPRDLCATSESPAIRPPLPSPEDIRSLIPPEGIFPSDLSASLGNMIVGRGIFKDGSRREQFWKSVVQNAHYDRDTNLLSPLYHDAYQGPPSPPPLPSADDIFVPVSHLKGYMPKICPLPTGTISWAQGCIPT